MIFVPFSSAFAASNCTVEANLPYTGTGATGHFGSVRNKAGSNAAGKNKRYHKGFDANIANGTNIAGPVMSIDGASKACDIKKPNRAQSALGGNKAPVNNRQMKTGHPTIGKEWLFNTNPGGYGYYLVFDCSALVGGGKQMLVRYAHVWDKNENPATPVLTGQSAIKSSAPHVHVEFSLDGTLVDAECMWGKLNSDKGCPVAGKPNLCGADWETMKTNCPSVKMTVNSKSNCQSKIPSSGTNTAVGDAKNTEPVTPDQATDTHEGGNTSGEGDGDVPAGPQPFTPATGGPWPEPGDPPTGTGGGSDADVSVGDGPGGSPNLTPEPKTPPEKLSGCGTDTWTAMVNQSVMQTRREDILNKRFIVKADSVLDYSCFDKHITDVAEKAGPIFSETKNWANVSVNLIGKTVQVKRELGSKSLDGALMDVVQSAATNYRRGQFNNKFLADSTPVNATAGQTNCDVMGKVWEAAKCRNFDDVDVFYTFEDLKTVDPREYPENMKCDQ